MADLAALGNFDPVAEGEQDERGVDLIGIRANLRFSPEERLRKTQESAKSLRGFLNAIQSARHRQARSGSEQRA